LRTRCALRFLGSVIGVLVLAACLMVSPGAAQTKPLNTIRELFDAFSACWRPPPLDQSKPGTEITIRFSLNAAGEIMGEPRFTYSSPALSSDVKSAYQRSVAEAISRCTPFPLSKALGGAIAGRPISTRFIDDRGQRRTENAANGERT
jgi:hypothetical protein